MASSGVIPLPPPPYPSIHYGPKPPWPPNGSLPPVLQKTGFLSPLRPGDQPPEKAEPLSPPPPTPGESPGAGTTSGDSQSPLMTKKPKRTRRKRCEKCEGCRTKDNCGRCSVCTNPNSTNSICKHRRCEVLTRRRPSLQVSRVYTAGRQRRMHANLMQILCSVLRGDSVSHRS
jgi:hypothetical protein